MNKRLLIVEDEETLRESLKRVLLREGYVVDCVGSAEAAIEVFEEGFYDLIITDIILPGITGIELLKKIKESIPEQIVVIMTAFASLETAVDALRTGAYDYVVKPVMHEEIKQIVKNALKQGALQEENDLLRMQIERQYDLKRMIEESPALRNILGELKQAAGSQTGVLLMGEIGTGKELTARAIHLYSNRADKPFIPVNLRAIPEDLLESRLFGYVKGDLKGVSSPRKGLFEEANGGTVFFREISDLPPGFQPKLLKVIEDGEMRPVGGTQGIKADLRFVCATSADMESAVREGAFLDGLYQRISGTTIRMPPLRERKEDIEPLVNYFVRKWSDDLCKTVKGIDDGALQSIIRYHWPGNIRELQNVVERAILISDDGVIRAEHLPPFFSHK